VPFGLSSLAAVVCLALSCPAAVALTGLQDVAVLGSGTDEAGAFCSDFTLTAAQARSALQAAQPIARTTFLNKYEWLPCYVRGKARIAGATILWELRAGGNGTFSFRDGNQHYIGCAGCRRRFGASRK
jgi:hypothetical protein